MPLQKQPVSISFAQGVDTKTDPKQVIPGKLLTLENGTFINGQRINKRNGHESLGQAGTVGSACASYGDELLAFDGNVLRSYASSLMSFQSKGAAISVEVDTDSVVANGYAQTVPDSAYHSRGLKAFAWEDSRGGIRYSVEDTATHQMLTSDAVLHASGVKPKVFALGNYIVFVFDNGTNIVEKHIAVLNPMTLSASSDIATNVNVTNRTYDAKVIGSRIFVSWNTSTGGGSVETAYITATLQISSGFEEAGQAATTCIGLWGDDQNQVWVSYYNGTKIKGFLLTYDLEEVVAPTDYVTVANVRNVTGILISQTSTAVQASTLLFEVSATNTYDYLTKSCALARSSGTITPAASVVFLRSVGLASKPFTYNGAFYVCLAYQSTTQPTYFVANFDKVIVAKIAPQLGGGLTAKSVLPEIITMSDTEFTLALLQKNFLDVETGTIYTTTGVICADLSFLTENTFLRSQAAHNLHITGGILSMYDGISVVEHGFHLFPEQGTSVSALTTGGIGAGTYQYCFVYEWKDNQGNNHRSAPSIPQTIVLTAGTAKTFTADTTNGSTTLTTVSSVSALFAGQLITGTGIPANTFIQTIGTTTIVMTNAATATNATVTITTVYTNKVTWTLPTLRLTQKRSPRSDVVISIFRTQTTGTIFYKVSSTTSPTVNDTTADTVSFADTAPDLYINGNELLYTTGGVLENIAAPAVSLITTYKNRVVVVPSEDKLTFWISKEVVGGPVEFTDFFVKPIDARDGDLTGLAQMDEKLILFKLNTCWLTAGDGPNDTGTQDDLVKPELITTDCGCKNPRSIVTTPNGLMFQSTKGIYLLDRSLQATYIGASVEAYNDLDITSAILVPNTNQVRFTTEEGTCLVYDYLFNQWSVFTNHVAVDSCVFEDLFTYLNPTGYAFQETVGTFIDDAAFIKLKLKTSWLSFAGLQGFQRVYEALILGEYKSAHRLIVRVAYDFNPYATQETYINPGDLLGTTTYGEDSPYGEGSPYGGEYPLYQFRIFMDRQKCETIQIEIEEVQDSDFGEGLSISAINLQVGLKSGVYKLPASRSFA